MRSFVKIKPSRSGKITLPFIDIGESCLNREFFTSQMCLLMLFAKIKFSRKFPNLQYFYFAVILAMRNVQNVIPVQNCTGFIIFTLHKCVQLQ